MHSHHLTIFCEANVPLYVSLLRTWRYLHCPVTFVETKSRLLLFFLTPRIALVYMYPDNLITLPLLITTDLEGWDTKHHYPKQSSSTAHLGNIVSWRVIDIYGVCLWFMLRNTNIATYDILRNTERHGWSLKRKRACHILELKNISKAGVLWDKQKYKMYAYRLQ